MSIEMSLITLARRMDRRTLVGRALVAGFATAGSVLLQAPKDALACTQCTACAAFCACSNCNSSGQCSAKNCGANTSCAYANGGCWTISSGKMCCDCQGSGCSHNPCTCRPAGVQGC